jgi:hypothetical protein
MLQAVTFGCISKASAFNHVGRHLRSGNRNSIKKSNLMLSRGCPYSLNYKLHFTLKRDLKRGRHFQASNFHSTQLVFPWIKFVHMQTIFCSPPWEN